MENKKNYDIKQDIFSADWQEHKTMPEIKVSEENNFTEGKVTDNNNFTYDYNRDAFRSAFSADRSDGSIAKPNDGGSNMGGNNPKKSKNEKKKVEVTWPRLIIAGIILVALTFSATTFGFGLFEKIQNPITGKNATVFNDSKGFSINNATGSDLTVKEITDVAADSVVEISTESTTYDFFGQEYNSEGAGSGVIISDDGYILTNHHVIADATNVTVTLARDGDADKKVSYEAKFVGSDKQKDLAVLKIQETGLKAAEIGNSDQLGIGDLAVVIGNPLGIFGGTVSAGIVSSVNRQLQIEDSKMELIQTDASVNPGNSGGGLFNAKGQLVGIVVAKSSGNGVEGIGFAIPINKAIEVAETLIKGN
ncbi:MAG: S1C family serine protease [Anaerovoracaceae bacterium]